MSIIPTIWEMIHGRDASDHTALHNKYGPVVRTGPTRLSFAGGAQAWKDIYGLRKGHAPAPYKDRIFYRPPFNGAESILTARSEPEHKQQRKVLSSGFSEKSLREQEPLLLTWATKLLNKLKERTLRHEKVDLVEFFNFTTFDIMADLTFGESLNMRK
jgi:cytochrome P450